jgi:hypothetical protein
MLQLLYGVGVCMAIFLSCSLKHDASFVEKEWE